MSEAPGFGRWVVNTMLESIDKRSDGGETAVFMSIYQKESLPRRVQEYLNRHGRGYQSRGQLCYVLPTWRAKELERIAAEEAERP